MKSIIVGIVFIFYSISLHAEFQPIFNKVNTTKDAYDYILPTLMRYAIVEPSDNIQVQIEKMVKHINFYSTPGMFERYNGLGTKALFQDNSSNMLKSGNLFCSEQAIVAALAFFQEHNIARRDVNHHTFFEILTSKNHWTIVDPYTDMRIKNKNGEIASFLDIQKYIDGDKSVLKLPKNVSPRIEQYLKLFDEKLWKKQVLQNGLRTTTFGEQKRYSIGKKKYINKSYDFVYNDFLTSKSIDLNKTRSSEYFADYILANINSSFINKKNKKALSNTLQDIFLNGIFENRVINSLELPTNFYTIYIARQYQLLNRYEKALSVYNQIVDKNAQILFYISQIYFKTGKKVEFLKLSSSLKHNIYYRMMYYKLIGSYLQTSDEEEFKYRAFSYL